VSGNGPLKRRMRTKGFLKSFFETWDHLFISLDGEFFLVYPSRNATEPLLFLSLSDVKNIRLELADNHREVNRNANSVMEDKFVIVLAATTRDNIKLRSPPPPPCLSPRISLFSLTPLLTDSKTLLLESLGCESWSKPSTTIEIS
jgi:hypothetical protein